MKKYSSISIIIVIITLLLASGCGAGDESGQEPPEGETPGEKPAEKPEGEEPDPDDPSDEPEEEPAVDEPVNHLPGELVDDPPTGPESFEGTIELEGTEEPMRYVRVELPEIGVATYIPEDMEVVEAEPGGNVRIRAAYGGAPRDDVYLEMDLYEPEKSLDEIMASLEETMEYDGYQIHEVEDSERQYPWGIEEWAFESEDGMYYGGYYVGRYVGRVIFGNVGERTLVVTTHMPVQFGDGTVPRLRKVMAEMKWYLDWE